MNGPIISPGIFYWIAVLSHVKGISLVGLIICVILFLVFLGCFVAYLNLIYDEDNNENRNYLKLYKKLTKISFSVLVVCGLLYIFIPSKETSVEMLIAKYVTYENTQWTLEKIKEAVDYIISAFKTMK